jgi:uncharacterized protein
LQPGDVFRATVRLNHTGYEFPKGHRIRLSLSSNYWPIAWPSPEPVTLTLVTGAARLDLPGYTGTGAAPSSVHDEPLRIEGLRRRVLRDAGYNRRIETDMAAGTVAVTAIKDVGHWQALETGLECEGSTIERYIVRPPDPLSTEAEVSSLNAMSRGGWRVEARTRTLVRCTAEAFKLDLDLDAYEDRRRMFRKSWSVTIPRRGV